MKKQKRKVTVNVLSDTTGIDRRTVKKRLIEAGLFPCDQEPLAKCLAAVKPAGTGSTTLESAKAKLLEAKIRQIERDEKLTGGELAPVNWFVRCVNDTFQDHFSNCIQNVFNDATNELKLCRAPYIKEHTDEQLKQDDIEYEKLKSHLLSWLEHARKSLRRSIDNTRDELIRHLRNGTKESGGKTSYGDICDFMESIAKELSDSAHAEMMTAIRAARSSVSEK